ncbi:MAG: hypothetical protein ABID84_03795 [Chloroflexota bacterium]
MKVAQLMRFLQVPDTFGRAAAGLMDIRATWDEDEIDPIIDTCVPHLTSGDASIAQSSAILVEECISRRESSSASATQEEAVRTLVTGPLSLNGPAELFQLPLNSLEHSTYVAQVNLRRTLHERFQDVSLDPERLFALARKLLEIGSDQHSDELLRPTIDYAITVTNDEWRQTAVSLLDIMKPSQAEIERNREGVGELSKHAELPAYLNNPGT